MLLVLCYLVIDKKFKCVVPVIAFVLLPVAVDNLIVVGVIAILSFSATDS